MDYDNYERTYIYAFHMPFFFFVSGLLHKYNGSINWTKYCRTLLFPMFVFIVLLSVCSIPLFKYGIWDYTAHIGKAMPENISMMLLDFIKKVIRGIIYSGGLINGPAWFLIALFWCKVITDTIEKYGNKYIQLGGVIFLSLLCVKTDYFYLGQTCMALPFFFFGHKYKNSLSLFLTSHKDKMLGIFFICLCITIALTSYNGKVSVIARMYGTHRYIVSMPTFYLNAMVASIGVLALSLCFKRRTIIEKMGKSLISILLLHGFFIYTLKYTVGWVTEVTPMIALYLIFASFAILMCCYYMHRVLYKYLPWMYGKW